jgi:hypothetical protein
MERLFASGKLQMFDIRFVRGLLRGKGVPGQAAALR